MKNLKLGVLTLLLTVGISIMFAQNLKKDATENIANNMLKQITDFVHLTDSQKVAITTIALDYEQKFKKLNLQSNSTSKKEQNGQIINEYRTLLNNILTADQKDSIQIKRIERAITNSGNGNEKKNQLIK